MNEQLSQMQQMVQQANLQKAMESNNDSVLDSDNMGKWELDVSPFLDRIKNDLLGNKLNGKGEWVNDPSLLRVMNEKGASEFIREVSSRVSIHMQFSDFSKEEIIEMASYSSENFSEKLIDNIHLWELSNPCTSTYESICMRLYDILFECLTIAKSGGMKRHREKSKNPYMQVQTQPEGVL